MYQDVYNNEIIMNFMQFGSNELCVTENNNFIKFIILSNLTAIKYKQCNVLGDKDARVECSQARQDTEQGLLDEDVTADTMT